MKIVYFNYLYDIKEASVGAAVHVKEFAAAMQSLGHELKVYHLNLWHEQRANRSSSLWQRMRQALKAKLRRYVGQVNQILANARYAAREAKILRREAPEVLLIRYNMLNFSATLLAKIMNIPVILEVNSPMAFERKHLVKDMMFLPILPQLIEWLNFKLATAIVVVSKYLKQYYVERGVQPAKIAVIPNGVDLERFSPAMSGERIIAKYRLQGKIVLGFVGSFHYWHGLDNLLQLIKHTHSRHREVAYLLVGDGPLKKKADEFVREHKLENMVFLTGYAPHHEIPEHLAAMDIVAAPYPKMDFFYFSPLKIFEYMAAGKAVIASRLGQIAELIQDGENGLLCEPDNFDQLLSITEKLIEDAALRHQLGVAARATMAERYSWQQNAQQIAEVIAKAATPQARAGKMELASEGFLNPNQIEV